MEDWLHPLLRALHYLLLCGLFGYLAFPFMGLRDIEKPRPGPIAIAVAWLAPFVSILLFAKSLTAMMGQSIAELEHPVIQAMVLETDLGWAFLVRLGLLSVGAMLLKRPRLSIPLYALAVLTLPWNGHSAATEEGLGLLHRANDGLHLLASGLWLGAIGWFAVLVAKARTAQQNAVPLLHAMHRFAPMGIALVVIITITGIANAQLIFGLSESSRVLSAGYGQLLIAKVILVGFMLLCAARHASIARKAVLTSADTLVDPDKVLAAVRTSLFLELGLACAVIGVVAALGLLSPMPGL